MITDGDCRLRFHVIEKDRSVYAGFNLIARLCDCLGGRRADGGTAARLTTAPFSAGRADLSVGHVFGGTVQAIRAVGDRARRRGESPRPGRSHGAIVPEGDQVHDSHVRAGGFRSDARRPLRTTVERGERENLRCPLVLAGVPRGSWLPRDNL